MPSCRQHPWHCWDRRSSHFLPAPNAWLPPVPPVPLALPALSMLPPELDALPLPVPPVPSAPPLHAHGLFRGGFVWVGRHFFEVLGRTYFLATHTTYIPEPDPIASFRP